MEERRRDLERRNQYSEKVKTEKLGKKTLVQWFADVQKRLKKRLFYLVMLKGKRASFVSFFSLLKN